MDMIRTRIPYPSLFSWLLVVIYQYLSKEYLLQQVCYSLGCLDSSNHQKVAIHLGPVDVIARITDKLCQESPLGSAVALSERVQIIGCAIEVHNFLHKLIVGKSFKIVLFFETVKNQISLMLNILSRAEIRSLLADIHGADLSRPIV